MTFPAIPLHFCPNKVFSAQHAQQHKTHTPRWKEKERNPELSSFFFILIWRPKLLPTPNFFFFIFFIFFPFSPPTNQLVPENRFCSPQKKNPLNQWKIFFFAANALSRARIPYIQPTKFLKAATYFITKSPIPPPCIVPRSRKWFSSWPCKKKKKKKSSFLKGIFLLRVASRIRIDWPAGFLPPRENRQSNTSQGNGGWLWSPLAPSTYTPTPHWLSSSAFVL